MKLVTCKLVILVYVQDGKLKLNPYHIPNPFCRIMQIEWWRQSNYLPTSVSIIQIVRLATITNVSSKAYNTISNKQLEVSFNCKYLTRFEWGKWSVRSWEEENLPFVWCPTISNQKQLDWAFYEPRFDTLSGRLWSLIEHIYSISVGRASTLLWNYLLISHCYHRIWLVSDHLLQYGTVAFFFLNLWFF